MTIKSKYLYITGGFTGSFILCLLGMSFEDIKHNIPVDQVLSELTHYILPFCFGTIAGIFGYFYWKRRLQQTSAYKALIESESKYKAAFFISPDAVNINTMDGIYIDTNEGFTALTKYTREDVTGVRSADINIWTIPEDREKLIKCLFEKGVVENLESIFRCKDGSLKTALMSARIIKIKDIPHILSVTRDITERKEAEKEIRKLQKAIESSKTSIVITDFDGNIEYVNPFFTELTGFSYPELYGNNPNILKSDFHDSLYYENMWATIKSGKTWEGEFRNKKKNGEYYWENAIISPVKNEKEEIIHFVAIKTDITESKKIYSELNQAKLRAEENERKIQTIFDTITEGVALNEIIYNDKNEMVDYRIIEVNKAFYSTADFTNINVIDNTATKLYGMSEESIKSFWIKHKEVTSTQYAEMISPLSNKCFFISTSPFIDNRFITVFFDITKLKQTEDELIKAKEKAEESDRLKTAFLQNMSHEVRTPLNAIAGFSKLITKPGQSPDKIEKFSDMISVSSDKLIEIITDVIEISQIQANLIAIKNTKFDFIKLINEKVNDFKITSYKKDIEFIFVSNLNEQEFIISSDKPKLDKILKHLLDNAFKFTEKGCVKLVLNIKPDRIEFQVSDTGIGISREMQQKIFEPFRQIETNISRTYGGNGLGLAIVKAYASMLSGSIDLQSEENKGTTVSVTLPVTPIIKQETTPNNKNIDRLLSNTILVVEDEYSNYAYLAELLSISNAKIIHAINGQQAIDICRSDLQIDCIFMDIKMPVMDGYTATSMIKAFRPELPIIAQTAYALESDKEKFLETGFDDYIIKPIQEKALFETIERHINFVKYNRL